jgi:hypothetical protein
MSRALADALEKLLAHPGDAPASLFTPTQRAALDALARATGFVQTRPQGRGVIYRIDHRLGVESHLRTLRPDATATLAAGLPKRAANIATRRDSKAGAAAHAFHYLLLKAAGAPVRWVDDDGRVLDLAAATRVSGAGVLAIETKDGWRSDCPLWLVENQALFDRTDWLPEATPASIAYYAGQIPARLLAWLAHRARVPEIILFPDYDGVGLQNYVRLRDQVTVPCRFWMMPDWRARLRRYGSNEVWRNTHAEFIAATTRLLASNTPTELLALCAAMSREGLALEHEAVWLDRPVE